MCDRIVGAKAQMTATESAFNFRIRLSFWALRRGEDITEALWGTRFRYSELAPFDTLIWPHPTENHIPWTLLRA
jgi:hypothetical protein